MPVSTRRPQEDEIESIAEVEEDDIQHAQSDDEDGPTPGAAEGSSTPVGRASRQKPSVVGLAARAQANARARAAAASPRSSATFSQSQRGELATIVADAVAASIAQLQASSSDARSDPPVQRGNDARRSAANSAPAAGVESDLDAIEGYVPDAGVENPHVLPKFTGGDTLLRPQCYKLSGDHTFECLAKDKPKGTLVRHYNTMEPALRFLFNARTYHSDVGADVADGTITGDEALLYHERLGNTLEGIYELLNRQVNLIQLRAQYGDNPSARERSKLEHLEDVLVEEDTLPASLDARITDLSRAFDLSYDLAKRNALAKVAAGKSASGGGGGGGGKLSMAEKQAAKKAREAAAAARKKGAGGEDKTK